MPLRQWDRNGILYLKGTVRFGKKSRSVCESTGLRAGDPNSKERFEFLRIQRENEIIKELQFGRAAVVTWTQAAADRLERRARELKAAGRPISEYGDKESEYVLKLTDFFRLKGVADKPLVELPKRVVNEYFDVHHISKGHAVATMHREHNAYVAVMNFAVEEYGLPKDFPRADLPEYDPLAQPVEKILYPQEVMMFIEEAQPHARPLLAVLFGTGRRSGELPWRLKTDYRRDPGNERLIVDWTKNGEPISVPLPPFAVAELDKWLASRMDEHGNWKDPYLELFLTDKGRPYARPKRQRGGIIKKMFAGTRERVAQRIERMAEEQAQAGNKEAARRLRERAAYIRTVTPHWARHNAASHLVMNDVGDARLDDYMGWKDPRMKRRYAHLSAEKRRELTAHLDFGTIAQTLAGKKEQA